LSSMEVQRSICVDKMSCLAQNLEYLDLSSNQLEWVPDGLFDLSSLRTLNLSHNSIRDLTWETTPDDESSDAAEEREGVTTGGSSRGWRHGLVSLVQLDLSNNQIADLGFMPLALSGCKVLRILQLNNNNLHDIPLELGLLKQLTTINLAGNPQKSVRTNVLSESCEVVLEYLFNKMDGEEVARVEEQHRAIETALLASPRKTKNTSDSTSGDGEKTGTVQDNVSPTLEWLEEQTGPGVSMSDEDRRTQKESVVKELKIKIDDMSEQLEKISISQSKRNELKKDLAMHRSQLLREEKQLKAESS